MGANEIPLEKTVPHQHVVFYTHAYNFWSHTAVSVASLLEHTTDVDLHIFVDKVNIYWLNSIQRICKAANSSVSCHLFDDEQTQGLKNCGYYGLATYNRLFIPELFAGITSHLIYMDSDMIVRHSIQELTEFPLHESVLAAVPGASKKVNHAKAVSLGHGQSVPYFNAGLMVINPRQWVNQKIRDRCIAFGECYPERIQLADQDMMNFVLAGNYQRLPMKWNVVTELFSEVPADDMDNLSVEELACIREDPAIVHFNGQFKPWHFTYKHPHKKTYVQQRRKLQKRPYISDDFPSLFLTKPVAFLRRHLSR